jgi:hypothetical protein
MTWRNVVTDNGSYDLETGRRRRDLPRVLGARGRKAVGDKGSGGGGSAAEGAGAAPLALLLALPLLDFLNPKRDVPKRRER